MASFIIELQMRHVSGILSYGLITMYHAHYLNINIPRAFQFHVHESNHPLSSPKRPDQCMKPQERYGAPRDA